MVHSRITYNLRFAKQLIKSGMFEELTLFYLLKIVNSNSVIYSTSIEYLFLRLKARKYLYMNFSFEKFKLLFDNLQKLGYITTDKNNHFVLKKINIDRGFYRSKIRFNKEQIHWSMVKCLLVKEALLHSKYRQEKAMSFRKKLVTKLKKEYKPVKVRKIREKIDSIGESYSDETIFTYREFASKLGMSVKQLHDLVKWLKLTKQLEVTTVKKILRKIQCNFEYIKEDLPKRGYFYVNSGNFVIQVLGSRIGCFVSE